jgi:hypothetical protein
VLAELWAEVWEGYSTLILALIPVVILQFILMVTALVSALRKKVPAADRLLWSLIIIIVGIIGPILYFAIGSKQLEEKEVQNNNF